MIRMHFAVTAVLGLGLVSVMTGNAQAKDIDLTPKLVNPSFEKATHESIDRDTSGEIPGWNIRLNFAGGWQGPNYSVLSNSHPASEGKNYFVLWAGEAYTDSQSVPEGQNLTPTSAKLINFLGETVTEAGDTYTVTIAVGNSPEALNMYSPAFHLQICYWDGSKDVVLGQSDLAPGLTDSNWHDLSVSYKATGAGAGVGIYAILSVDKISQRGPNHWNDVLFQVDNLRLTKTVPEAATSSVSK